MVIITVGEIYEQINQAADFSLAMEFDNAGILVGSPERAVGKVLAALDVTEPVLAEACAWGADLIVTHHPVIFHPLKRLSPDMVVWKLAVNDIAVISAHTNLDIAPGGVNDILAKNLRLSEIETLAPDNLIRCGTLARGMAPAEFAYYTKQVLDLQALRYCDGGQLIEKVAVGGGSCAGMLGQVVQAGAQAFVTSEVKHDQMIAAAQGGITLIDAGHYATERPVVDYLAKLVRGMQGAPEVRIAKSCVDVSTTI